MVSNFKDAKLNYASFGRDCRAQLELVNITGPAPVARKGAKLGRASFLNADVEKTNWVGASGFLSADFTGVKAVDAVGLRTVPSPPNKLPKPPPPPPSPTPLNPGQPFFPPPPPPSPPPPPLPPPPPSAFTIFPRKGVQTDVKRTYHSASWTAKAEAARLQPSIRRKRP